MGTRFCRSFVLPSNQSTTLFRSVILTNPAASPFSLACFMYSAPDASLSCHARYTASSVKKSFGFNDGSVEVAPSLRRRVGVDFGSVADEESMRCVADCSESAGPEAFDNLVSFLALIACRKTSKGSVELIVDNVFSADDLRLARPDGGSHVGESPDVACAT